MSGFLNNPPNPLVQNLSNPLNSSPNPLNSTSNPNPLDSASGAAKPGISVFGNASTAPAAGGSVFGNTSNASGSATTSSTLPSLGSGPFSTLSGGARTNLPGGSLFGAGSSTTPSTTTTIPNPLGTAGTTPSIFGNVSKPATVPASGSLPSGGSTTLTTGAGPTVTQAAPSLFGNSGTSSTALAGGSLFGAATAKPTDNSISQPSVHGTTTGTTPASTVPAQTTGLPLKSAESAPTTTQGSMAQPAADASATSAGTAGTGASLFGGGGLFGKTPTAPVTSTPAAGSTAETSTTRTPSLFGTKTEEKKDGPVTTPTPSLGPLGATKTPPAASSTNTALSAKLVTSVAPPSMLKGKTLEEIVNRWSSDLQACVSEFGKFAAEVALWDRALVENGNNLSALYSHIINAEFQQGTIDQSLSHIEQQQKDLAATLDSYENLSQELLGVQGGNLRTLDIGPADTERDKNYALATNLQIRLDDLSDMLVRMIDTVNALSVSNKPNGESNDDPVSQISQILSSHLESLQWIDGAVREVEGKVVDIGKRIKDHGHSLPGNTRSRGFGLSR